MPITLRYLLSLPERSIRAAFAVIGDELFHGTTKLDPAALIDGHGRFIANVSNF